MPSYNWSAPPFSFMDIPNPTDESCAQNDFPCLPVQFLNQLKYQMFCETDDTEFATRTIFASIGLDCGEDGVDKVHNFNGHAYKISADGDPLKFVVNFERSSNNVFNDYADGTCFTISIYIHVDIAPEPAYDAFQYCFSQCFFKQASGSEANECYTTVYEYSSTSNCFGFNYQADSNFTNIIRLPTYLHSPVNVEEEKSYSKSNGVTVKLMHRIWKDFQVKVDYMPSGMLEKFTFMTAHPILLVKDQYAGVNDFMIRQEKVDIAWQEENLPIFKMAQAKTVLRLAEPRESISSNCI